MCHIPGRGGRKKQAHRSASLAYLLSSRPVKDLVSKRQGGQHLRNNVQGCLLTYIVIRTHVHSHTCKRNVSVIEKVLSCLPSSTQGIFRTTRAKR